MKNNRRVIHASVLPSRASSAAACRTALPPRLLRLVVCASIVISHSSTSVSMYPAQCTACTPRRARGSIVIDLHGIDVCLAHVGTCWLAEASSETMRRCLRATAPRRCVDRAAPPLLRRATTETTPMPERRVRARPPPRLSGLRRLCARPTTIPLTTLRAALLADPGRVCRRCVLHCLVSSIACVGEGLLSL